MSKLTMSLVPIVTLVIFIIVLYFNYAASTGQFSDKDVGEVSDTYNLEITPAGWTFSIWGFIYIWQFLWIVYTLYLTCKYEMKAIVFGKVFWICYNSGNTFNVIWILLWVNEYIWPSAIFLILIATSLITSAYIAHKYMFVDINKTLVPTDNYGGVDQDDEPQDVQPQKSWIDASTSIKPLIYGLVLNGIPFYATWTVIASNLNFGIALCHKSGMTDRNASILSLCVLTCIILFYWYLDFYRFRQYLKYTYSPYIVLIVAFCGVLTNEYSTKPTWTFTLVLLILAILGTIAKVIMGIMMRNQPSSMQSV
eukprot:CAMPEP_0197025560 /NCGR_PEP_ID=MMETSP1384-20130603/5846_1 /TAXON_ID=29189 /ORGANISM="Ammonia sp." /LENGTH=308 /DNA_ID=CAMNT_0042454099 /DNA_START=76 /DNA_END=1002 /DNA_ORIENTATION=-